MKKRILAIILCVVMILPCFAWSVLAADATGPNGEELTNIAPNGKTYQSSNWNQDSSGRYINNGVLYSSWQFWRPGSVERPDTPGIDDTLQYTGMKFNNYYSFNEVTIYAHKYATYDGAFCGKCGYENHDDGYLYYDDTYPVYKKNGIYWEYKYKDENGNDRVAYFNEDTGKYYTDNRGTFELDAEVVNSTQFTQVVDYYRCKTCDTRVLRYTNQRNNIKFTVMVLVQGQWIEAGHGYNNDMKYVIQGVEKDYQILGEDLASVTIKLDNVLPAYNEDGDIIVDEMGQPIYTNFATTKNVRIEFTEYGAYAHRGTTDEIGFVYSSDQEVTHVNYKGIKYEVTKDEDAAIPTYRTMYTYKEKVGDKEVEKTAPLVFTVSEKFGGAEFPIVQAETYTDTGKQDENGDQIYHSANRDRYLFKYDDNGKVVITQKLASTHDWWLVPLVQEVEVNGFLTVNKPKFDVPEGAEVVSDAALGGMAGATTSFTGQYPLLANDRNSTTQWQANDYEGQSFWVDFDMEYKIRDVKFDFGAMPSNHAGAVYTYNVYVKKNGAWELLAGNQTSTTTSDLLTENTRTKFDVDEVIGGVKIEFTSSTKDGEPIQPRITEVNAPIADGKQCVFLSAYLDFSRASSSAQGNLACYGEAYCSSSFDYSNISDVNFINDGQVTDDAYSWYAQDFLKGTYCGIKLKETESVTKVVLYFNDMTTGGNPEKHVMSYDIQALVNGSYVTVASSTSYDPEKKSSIISLTLDTPVTTDDIRIVYQSNGLVFPYLKEMEIFSAEKVYSAFQGYQLDLSMRTLHGKAPTTAFAQKTVVSRAKYMDKISPIEHLILAAQYGIDPAYIK